ncbi:MAG TPA: isocitrate lyase/phosphoenolpyruvate mutase family protein [Candidatus Nanoarchaeia archaeon]|nr:isocitrate lyase/phosphoenolpyruvate mutase family protein [Candidatus Nanoarchaeia archaeon]
MPRTKSNTLKELLKKEGPIILLGAHDPLTAKMAEEAGCDAIWSSGFEISASYGVPDANIIPMSVNLDVARRIKKAVKIPVVADCDNGYGNVNNVKTTVEEFESAGIDAICIEDNLYPKNHSFWDKSRNLESIPSFSGKISAGISARLEDLVFIARTEALIQKLGVEEALKRAHAYADAGADMILIHSKAKKPDEVLEFASKWNQRVPLVAVPTIYDTISANELYKAGIKMVIFANHGVRAEVKAIKEKFGKLMQTKRASDIREEIASLQEIYDLVGVKEMQENEEKFTPKDEKVKAVILAAGFDQAMAQFIQNKPKCMLEVDGKSLLEKQIDSLHEVGINDITVIRGYKKDAVNVKGVKYFDNDNYANTSSIDGLFLAKDELNASTVVMYSDILFERQILERLLTAKGDISLVVDRSLKENVDRTKHLDKLEIVQTSRGSSSETRYMGDNIILKAGRALKDLSLREADGEFIGMAYISKKMWPDMLKIYESMPKDKPKGLIALFDKAIEAKHKVSAVDIYRGWTEIHSYQDYAKLLERFSS